MYFTSIPSVYACPPANDVHDGLLELIREGKVMAFLLNGRIHYCARENMRPEYAAAVVDYATVERQLRREEEQEMAAWN